MATKQVQGIFIEIEGDGAPVVCIHGLGGSSNNWTPVLPAFEGRKVIRVDLPGSARSPPGTYPASTTSTCGPTASTSTSAWRSTSCACW